MDTSLFALNCIKTPHQFSRHHLPDSSIDDEFNLQKLLRLPGYLEVLLHGPNTKTIIILVQLKIIIRDQTEEQNYNSIFILGLTCATATSHKSNKIIALKCIQWKTNHIQKELVCYVSEEIKPKVWICSEERLKKIKY